MRLRETKQVYFWCKLAEGRVKIVHVVRLRETKQIRFLSTTAEESVAQTIFGDEAEGNEIYILLVETG